MMAMFKFMKVIYIAWVVDIWNQFETLDTFYFHELLEICPNLEIWGKRIN